MTSTRKSKFADFPKIFTCKVPTEVFVKGKRLALAFTHSNPAAGIIILRVTINASRRSKGKLVVKFYNHSCTSFRQKLDYHPRTKDGLIVKFRSGVFCDTFKVWLKLRGILARGGDSGV